MFQRNDYGDSLRRVSGKIPVPGVCNRIGPASIYSTDDMQVRHDVVRGLRAGSFLLAGMLLVFAVYRMMHEPAGVAPTPVPETVVAPAPAPAPATSVTASSEGPALPPPPPAKGRKVAPAPKREEMIAQAPPKLEAIEEVKPVEEKKTELAAETQPKDAPETVEAKLETAPAVAADPARPDNRGKKVLKAVGKFLHIGGKKETPAPQQAIRPEQN